MDISIDEELQDLSFDTSFLEDNSFLYANDGEKKFPDVVHNDVSLDTSWMSSLSLTNVGKNMNNFASDVFTGIGTSPHFENPAFVDSESDSDSASFTGSEEVPSPSLSDCGDKHIFQFGISDEKLTGLSVKDLNTHVKQKGMSKEEAKRIKKRRRTLKNRGYAHSCRMKRITEKSTLIAGKDTLEKRNFELKRQVENVTAERDILKDRMLKVHSFIHNIAKVYDLTPFLQRKG